MSCLPKSFDLVNLLSQKLEKIHFIREAPRPSAKFRHFVGFWTGIYTLVKISSATPAIATPQKFQRRPRYRYFSGMFLIIVDR